MGCNVYFQAIGLRMTCENEADQRNRQRRAIQAQINEKRAELDRYLQQVNNCFFHCTLMDIVSAGTWRSVSHCNALKQNKIFNWKN
jgi:hypothetical protein